MQHRTIGPYRLTHLGKKIFSPPKTGKGKIFEGDINKSVASLLKEMELAGMNLTTIKENNGNGSN